MMDGQMPMQQGAQPQVAPTQPAQQPMGASQGDPMILNALRSRMQKLQPQELANLEQLMAQASPDLVNMIIKIFPEFAPAFMAVAQAYKGSGLEYGNPKNPNANVPSAAQYMQQQQQEDTTQPNPQGGAGLRGQY